MIERISMPEKPVHSVITYQTVTYGTTYAPLRPTKWLDNQLLADWLLSTNLIELLLKTYTHIEVIKRCPEIIKFLA
jgi:hypothetical protein